MLHRELDRATPSQRLAWAARNERLAKIASKAVPDRPIALNVPKFIKPAAIECAPMVDPPESWAERQKRLHPEPWFSIVEEIEPVEPRRPTIEEIQKACCKHFSFSKSELIADRRTAPVALARQVAMYLCKTLTTRSLPEIGRKFGGRDHTTVLHAVRKISGLVPHNTTLCQDIEIIRAELGA